MKLAEKYIATEAELKDWVPEMLNHLQDRKVIALEGDLGAGKTTLVKFLGEAWGIIDTVTSPTFSLINVYICSDERKIYHMDLYRLETIEEALDIGIEEYLDSGEIVLIEWPQLIESLLPADVFRIRITRVESEMRKIVLLTDQ